MYQKHNQESNTKPSVSYSNPYSPDYWADTWWCNHSTLINSWNCMTIFHWLWCVIVSQPKRLNSPSHSFSLELLKSQFRTSHQRLYHYLQCGDFVEIIEFLWSILHWSYIYIELWGGSAGGTWCKVYPQETTYTWLIITQWLQFTVRYIAE